MEQQHVALRRETADRRDGRLQEQVVRGDRHGQVQLGRSN
jgi:hypothetical protein